MEAPPPQQDDGKEGQQPPHLMVAIEVDRKTNAGTTVRCSVAFGAACLCLVGVGRPRFSKHGSFGSHHYLPTRAFSSWQALRQHADAQKCHVVGICLERSPGSLPVHTRPFNGPTIFVTSTKGKTLTEEQRAACHALVHVPIMGGPAADAVFSPSGGGLTLEADVALSIVLHHITAWSQCQAHSFRGQKYVLGTPGRTGEVDEDERQRLQEERRRQRQVADILSQRREGGGDEGEEEEEEEEEVWPGLWGADDDEEEEEEVERRATSACT